MTIALILANVAIFVLGSVNIVSVAGGALPQNDYNVYKYGAYPCEIFARCDNVQPRVPISVDPDVELDPTKGPVEQPREARAELPVEPVPPWLTILTSTFLHGSLLHLGGNMLFLWIFGNNVEDSMSRGMFVLFYIAAAFVSALAQSAANVESAVPQIGASGAVAGVIGAYLVMYPRARILTWFTALLILFIHVPAWFVAGLWGLGQFLPAVNQLYQPDTGAGIAYIAHLAGFVFGMFAIRLIANRNPIYEQLYGPGRRGAFM